MLYYMRKVLTLFLLLLGFIVSYSQPNSSTRRISLPNGWSLSPVGNSLQLGDLPLNIAVSPTKKYVAVTNNGQSTQSILLIDVANKKVLDNVVIPKSWLGLHFSGNEKYLYASGGNDNWILKYAINNNKLVLQDSIILGKKWPVRVSPAGIELNDATQTMYVVTKENNSLYTIDLKTKSADSLKLGAEAYTCLLSPDKKDLYISLWGGDKILIYDVDQKKLTGNISVGDNPNDICITKNGQYLFVSNGND